MPSRLDNPLFRAYLQALLITDFHARVHRPFGKEEPKIEISFSSTNYWGLEWAYMVLKLIGHRVYIARPKQGKWGITVVLSTYLPCEYLNVVHEVYRENKRAGLSGRLRAKKVPQWLFQVRDKDMIYSFLAGLLDGDGTINISVIRNRDLRIRMFIYTHDRELIQELVTLLKIHGIETKYYDSVKGLTIYRKDVVYKLVRECSEYIMHPLKKGKVLALQEYLSGRATLVSANSTVIHTCRDKTLCM